MIDTETEGETQLRYSIEDNRDTSNIDVEEALHDAQYQFDLYMAADEADGVAVRVYAQDDSVYVEVRGNDPMRLRRISVQAKMPWLRVQDSGEDGEDCIELASAEEIGRKYAQQTVCKCGKTVVEAADTTAWLGHLGICEATDEDSNSIVE